MKKSKLETAETRKKIVETASRLFRRDGIHATGLSDVMTAAGLTHGGFYRHFDSKDQLVADAVGAGFDSLSKVIDAVTRNETGQRAVKAIAENYLSTKHRDDAASGCPFAGMGEELARADDETRSVTSKAFVEFVDAIATQMPRKKPEVATSDAIFMASAMIGALTMSRIVNDAKLSASILRAAKEHLADI
jgi:TetR/AcrR family transcriptional regulator, transcriptional repressor for nem operon